MFEYVGVSPVTDTVRTNHTRSQDSVEVYQVSVCSVRCVQREMCAACDQVSVCSVRRVPHVTRLVCAE